MHRWLVVAVLCLGCGDGSDPASTGGMGGEGAGGVGGQGDGGAPGSIVQTGAFQLLSVRVFKNGVLVVSGPEDAEVNMRVAFGTTTGELRTLESQDSGINAEFRNPVTIRPATEGMRFEIEHLYRVTFAGVPTFRTVEYIC
ncbi:MAG: hypothetical protein AAGF92_01395 [Myxococcota bacterium]